MKKILLATVAIASVFGATTTASADNDETRRQVSRSIESAIAERVGQGAVSDSGVTVPLDGQEGFFLNAFFTEVTPDAAGDTDTLGAAGGFDKFFTDRFLLGLAGSVAESNTDGGPDQTSTSVNPYAAYIFGKTDHSATFGVAVLGYEGSDSETSVSASAAVNHIWRGESTRIRVKAGVSWALIDPDSTADVSTWGFNTGAEIGFPMGKETPYLGLDYDVSYPDIGSSVDDLFAIAGVRVEVSEASTLGLEGKVELINDDTGIWTGTLSFRHRL